MPEIADYMKVVASLAIVVALIYALYYYFNNYIGKVSGTQGRIKILESRPVGKQRFLILAKIEDSLVLLSSDESGIKILKEWKEEES